MPRVPPPRPARKRRKRRVLPNYNQINEQTRQALDFDIHLPGNFPLASPPRTPRALPPFAVDDTEFSPIQIGELQDIGLADDEVVLAALYKALELGGPSSPEAGVKEERGRDRIGTGTGNGLESGNDGGGDGGGCDDANADMGGDDRNDNTGARNADADEDADDEDEGGKDLDDGHGETGLGLDPGDDTIITNHLNNVNTQHTPDTHRTAPGTNVSSDIPPYKRKLRQKRPIWPGLNENVVTEGDTADNSDPNDADWGADLPGHDGEDAPTSDSPLPSNESSSTDEDEMARGIRQWDQLSDSDSELDFFISVPRPMINGEDIDEMVGRARESNSVYATVEVILNGPP